jgi:hypothetical protein
MGHSSLRLASASGLIIGLILSGSSATGAQSVVSVCAVQWKQAKTAGTTNSETWPQFLAQCRQQQRTAGGAAAVVPAPTVGAGMGGGSAAAPTVQAPAPASRVGKTVRECNDEYAANRAAISWSGQTKRDFIAACRAGTETIPQRAASAPAPASLSSATYASAPAPAPVLASATHAPAQTATAAGEFTSEEQARYRCPSDSVVWVNTKSRVYHFAGTENYGQSKRGAYMCEADAKAAGDRAAMNDKHP